MGMQVEFLTRRSRKGHVIELDPNSERFLGSEGDIALSGEGVLPRHARLFMTGSGPQIEPVGQAAVSVNGTPIRGPAPISSGDWLAFGSVIFQVNFRGQKSKTEPSSSQSHTSGQVIRIGRLPECHLSIPSPLVSRFHAELHCEDGRITIQDLNSTNGTFINGRRIFAPTILKRADKVEIAAFAFAFTGDALVPIDASGLVRIETHGLTKEVHDRSTGKRKLLLDGIDLVVEPGEFIVIFGTSGSGKSTLLDALNGRRPASSGLVLFNGTDLYSSFDMFRAVVGYVPQQDIVHRKILVQNALQYTARLRLPSDTSDKEIESHIKRVLDQVGLSEKASSRIDTPAPLSGGQLKRVSLAVELIADPNILFLDEVTSGLDAGTDKKMMQLFSELASKKKTIICVTHSLENVEVCNLVLLLHRGKVVFFGPPKDALQHFGISRLSDVYELIENSPDGFWAEKYAQSPFFDTYVRKRRSPSQSDEAVRQTPKLEGVKARRTWFDWSQLRTLTRRYIDLLFADRRNLVILLLQAPLIAALIGLVFDASGQGPARAAAENQIAFMLVLSAIWCGCLNSTREVVKELPIYLRERAVNLGIGPYLASKLLPLAVLCLVQCLEMLLVIGLLTTWSGNFPATLLTLFLTAIAATSMGLAVSTFVDSNDKATTLIPILLIPQVVLANFIVKLGRVGEAIAQATMISFSGFDAMRGTLSKEVTDLMPAQNAFTADLAIMTALGSAFLLAALAGLKLKDYRK